MGLGKCISGFKYGVILGIYIKYRGCIFFVVVKESLLTNFRLLDKQISSGYIYTQMLHVWIIYLH